MTVVAPHPVLHRARSEADAAWSAYASTCQMSGTPEQRAWAYGRASAAEDRAAAIEHAAHGRPAA